MRKIRWSQILIGGEEAERSEQRYQDAMAKEQQAAQARTEAGLWGTGTYDVEPFLPAQGENGGLNLPWGDYDVTVEYDSPADMELRAVSAGRQTFIQDGAWRLAAGAGNGGLPLYADGFNERTVDRGRPCRRRGDSKHHGA